MLGRDAAVAGGDVVLAEAELELVGSDVVDAEVVPGAPAMTME